MGILSEEIGRIVNLLEVAKEDQDWAIIQTIIDALDDIGFKQKLIKLMGKNVYMFRYYQHEEFERLNVH